MVNATFPIPARRLAGISLVVLAALLAGCGGSSADQHIQPPMVRAFSPFMSPIDFNTLQQNPTFTDGKLTVSTDANYPGKIVIIFQEKTELDPASVFTGGRPELGIDLSALQILRYVPGSGNEALPLADVTVEADRIICTPAVLPLSDGQYSIGVLKNIRNTRGKGLIAAPVFHSFTVGAIDSVRPFVVTSSPANNEIGVGAGAPPPTPPAGPAMNTADVRTNIFGPTSPDVTIRFNEGINASTVTMSNITAINAGWPPGAGPPPTIAPAPTFPMLKSVSDGATLPSNGHEILWRADPLLGGFPFGTIIEVTIVGLYDTQQSADADPDRLQPDNGAPVADLAGNGMLVNYKFQFQTLAPPDLPANAFPEYSIWWAATDRVGSLDAINQQGLADQFTGAQSFPFGVPRNVLQQYTDTVANAQNIPGFEPTELSIDNRTNGGTCHTWVYAMSPNSGQLVVIHSRTSLPVALINTPKPGGLSNQTGGGQAANVLMVTNSSANTMTTFDFSNVSPGASYINGPIFILNVQPTGNTPRAVSISLSPTGSWNRDPGFGGPPVPIIMYADFTDGVVNTTRLLEKGPVTSINLGPNSAPNDIVMSPCLVPPGLFMAAISQGGLPGEGKVAYYISGPSCSTGVSSGVMADSLVGSLTGFDGPAGLDEVLPMGNGAWWVLAESGAAANRVRTLGTEVGYFTQPRIINTFEQVGANPVAVAHRSAWINTICIDWIGAPWLCAPYPMCWYNGTEQNLLMIDRSMAVSQDLYICARGAGQITVVNLVTGARDYYQPEPIPGIRIVASEGTQ